MNKDIFSNFRIKIATTILVEIIIAFFVLKNHFSDLSHQIEIVLLSFITTILFIRCLFIYYKETMLIEKEEIRSQESQAYLYSQLLISSTKELKDIDFNYSPRNIEFLKFGVGAFFVLGLMGSLLGLSQALTEMSSKGSLDTIKSLELIKNVFAFSIVGVSSGLIIEWILIQDLYQRIFQVEQETNKYILENKNLNSKSQSDYISSLLNKDNLNDLLNSLENLDFSDKISVTSIYLNKSMIREYKLSRKFVQTSIEDFTLKSHNTLTDFLNRFNDSVKLVTEVQSEIKKESLNTLNNLSQEIIKISNLVSDLDSNNKEYITVINDNNNHILGGMSDHLNEQKDFIFSYKESVNKIQSEMKDISEKYNIDILAVHEKIHNKHDNIMNNYLKTNSDIFKVHQDILLEHINIKDLSIENNNQILLTHNQIKDNYIDINNQINESHNSIKDKYIRNIERFIKIFIDLSNDLKYKNTQNLNNIQEIISKYSEVGDYFKNMFNDISKTILNEQKELVEVISSELKKDSEKISQETMENINKQIESLLKETNNYIKNSIDISFGEVRSIQGQINQSIVNNNDLNKQTIQYIKSNFENYETLKIKSDELNKDISSGDTIAKSISSFVDKLLVNQNKIKDQVYNFEKQMKEIEHQSQDLMLSQINQKMSQSESNLKLIIQSHNQSFDKISNDIDKITSLENSLKESNHKIQTLNDHIKLFGNKVESKINTIDDMTKSLDLFSNKINRIESSLKRSIQNIDLDKEVKIENT